MKTLNSNSKQRRKRKSSSTSFTTGTASISISTTAAVAVAVPKMNESTSEFIDYLSNVNNETGISEESLLLSPILDVFHGNITRQRGSSTSSSKRLRSSARLKRRQAVLSNQDDNDNEDYDQCVVMNPMGGFDLDQSIPEHDVYVAGSSQVFSPLAASHGHGSTNRSLEKLVEEQQDEEEEEEDHKVNLLKGALDTSACPSLGLGSVGSRSSLDSYKSRDLSYASCQSSDVHCNNSISPKETLEVELNSSLQIEENGPGGATSHEDGDDADDDGVSEGVSFDSALSHGTEESLQDSMEHHGSQKHAIHQDEMEQGQEEEEEYSDSIETNDSCHAQTIYNPSNSILNQGRARVTQSPLQSNIASTQSFLSEESDTTPKRIQNQSLEEQQGSMDQTQEATTPTTDSKETNNLILTPIMGTGRQSLTSPKSIPQIRLGLTPRLKKLRAKMIRESLGRREKGSSEREEQDTRSPLEMEESESNGMEVSSTPPNDVSELGAELSLTPALKSLRDKLYRDSMSIGEPVRSNFDIDPTEDSNSIGQEMIKTPNDSAKSPLEMASSCASSSSKTSDQLSLTPALKAFRMKLMNSTFSPLEDTPQSHESSSSSSAGERRQFLSPSLRPSTSTFTTSGSSRRTRRVVFEEDDSYLEQPTDLSSAKKNLNAQSSALVERLRGAAHKRMISITRSRDSLAAKECLHLEKLEEVPGNENEGTIEDGQNDEWKTEKQVEEATTMELKRSPRTVPSGLAGVPVVQKRRATVPISPKLGMRRSRVSSKPSEKVKSVTKSNNSAAIAIAIQRTIIKCVNNKQHDVPKTKRRPKTIPKSPLLGARRKTDNKQSSITLKSSGKRVFKSPSMSPVGLGFLDKTPTYKSTGEEENIAPFTLHSSIRAKERAEFETCRVLNEQLRSQAVKKERGRLLNEKYKELGRLKENLR